MFKKLKDKLAEEVKSSPQRIQQFAQAAQAAVTSASSSITDITNNDLFSIGDNDGQQGQQTRAAKLQSNNNAKSTFQDMAQTQQSSLQTSIESEEFGPNHDIIENQRQRRLSNSSFASDVSFRLPSYESPSMYHLQSDMEVSASEAEERGFSSGTVSLDRVTKEQIYAAYKRTQERYSKYRTQYADLARHYKLLERENAKARSVLVETQDKALRRISELREQCTLEQSAKAHLEKALRVEIEEKNIKIDTLNTKITLLQNPTLENICNTENETEAQLINISDDNENSQTSNEQSSEIITLNNKIEKLEQLVNKYKESLKATREKNAQITTELKILSSDLDKKNKENELLKTTALQLTEAQNKIQELNYHNEDLQNQINSLDFNKVKEISTLEIHLQKAQEEIANLKCKIEVFTKREEEYAISLAENKLSIHKELESKENEIKSLKDSLSVSLQEIQSLNIVVNDYKNSLSLLEEERIKVISDTNELNVTKNKVTELESQIHELTQKCQSLENSKTKACEEYECLQLQLKQETAEKLAMIDRNVYLENRNTQLSEENAKKKSQLSALESELQELKSNEQKNSLDKNLDRIKMLEEIDIWKSKYRDLESEIQEERVELVKLQTEIEKLLTNHELIQMQNTDLNNIISELKSENTALENKCIQSNQLREACEKIINQVKHLREIISSISQEAIFLKEGSNDLILELKKTLNDIVCITPPTDEIESVKAAYENLKNDYNMSQKQLQNITEQHSTISNQFNIIKEQNYKYKSEFEVLQKEKLSIMEKQEKINLQYENSLEQIKLLEKENQTLAEKIKVSENKCQELQAMLQNKTERCVMLEKENKALDENLKIMKDNNMSLSKELNNSHSEHSETDKKLKAIMMEKEELIAKTKDAEDKKENQKLVEKIKVSENKCQELQAMLQNNTERCVILEKEKRALDENLKVMADNNMSLSKDLENSHTEHSETVKKLKAIMMEKEELIAAMKHTEDSRIFTDKLQKDIKVLTEENMLLKTQLHNIAENVKVLESELSEVRKSHTEIEVEKDRLNAIIEQLERNEQDHLTDQETQTDVFANLLQQSAEETALEETNSHHAMMRIKDLTNEQDSLNQGHTALLEENRRLNSDIAGLQTYLTKISKENSVLNDKLRDLIASSENSPDKTENHFSSELKDETRSGYERIEDVLRENALLIEENLELKDQLKSQNYNKGSESNQHNNENKFEYNILKEKYNNLIETNRDIEHRMMDLEQMNKTLNSNILHIQGNNEKMRLTNEKLERRLDEALVSLRHLHSLQENTELEYLRNILYEYLTGSGTHSLTLAKVLAAVVKFDDTQTQQVIQKEKERQGFLRQLGLI